MNNNMFGTDGIRGAFGSSPFTVPELAKLGQAIAEWLIAKYGPQCSLLLANDTRLSCSVVKAALESGLLLYPIKITDGDILPSPALAVILQKKRNFDCALMISASHNPFHDNGIKLIDRSGKLAQKDEEQITQLFYQKETSTDYTSLGTQQYKDLDDIYLNQIKSFFKPDFLRDKKVVLDCANGATYQIAPTLFKELGADTITLFDKPNGLNINKQCGALHLKTLQEKVIGHQADFGFAFDGDGDRVIAVNRYGHLKNGDDLLTLLIDHPAYTAMDTVVGTVMSNQAFELFLHNKNKKLLRTPVGDKYITQELTQRKLLLGGEASGHIILRDYLPTGDGIFTALRICQTVIHTNNLDMITFAKFPQIHKTIPINNKKDLSQPPFSDIIAASKTQLHAGRLIIRYSGTEPVLRIMVEDDDCDHAQSICSMLSEKLQKELS